MISRGDEVTSFHERPTSGSNRDFFDPLAAPGSISDISVLRNGPDRTFSNLFSFLSSPVQQSGVGLLQLNAIQRVLISYPRNLLDPSFKSPIFHSSLMRSASAQTPEPLAVALCCVAANSVAEEASLTFVCNTFQDQRTKLANDFVSFRAQGPSQSGVSTDTRAESTSAPRACRGGVTCDVPLSD